MPNPPAQPANQPQPQPQNQNPTPSMDTINSAPDSISANSPAPAPTPPQPQAPAVPQTPTAPAAMPTPPQPQTPSSLLGSLDRPEAPVIQTHDGPVPIGSATNQTQPDLSANPTAATPATHAKHQRSYLLFLIGLGIIFFIALAVAYLLKG
jgi:hypothetical protein